MKFLEGNMGMSLGTEERKLLLELLKGYQDVPEDERFTVERMKLRLSGYKVEGTKWDKGRQKKKPCVHCDNYYYPHTIKNHEASCRTRFRIEKYDREYLERI
jgi:hypothetical protein